ncbi:hypothetical protein SBS92_24570, partial [Klebsiella pneumoniae]
MSGKKGRSMAGLPWIAAMAFFMQALDATILNTALPAIAHSLKEGANKQVISSQADSLIKISRIWA